MAVAAGVLDGVGWGDVAAVVPALGLGEPLDGPDAPGEAAHPTIKDSTTNDVARCLSFRVAPLTVSVTFRVTRRYGPHLAEGLMS